MMEPEVGGVKVEHDEFGFVKGYVCPFCGGPVKKDYVDDIGTCFFKCEKCHQQSVRLKFKERVQFEKALAEEAGQDKPSDVVIESTPEGLYVRQGSRRAGPFKTGNDIDSVQVAQQLGAEPKQVFCAKMRAYGAVEGSEKLTATREAAVEVGDTFTYTGDQAFFGRIQVAALGFPQSRYLRLSFRCSNVKEDCPSCDLATTRALDFNSADMDPSAFATYFDTNIPRDALRILTERGIRPGCPAWWNAIICNGKDERAVTQVIVMDLQGVEGRAWFIHGPKCDLKKAPNWVIVEGWLCKGKLGRIGVLVTAFTPESEVATPKPEEVEKAWPVLRGASKGNSAKLEDSGAWKVAEALQRKSQLKGNEIAKGYVSDLLTVASPVWVKTPEGPPQLGATTVELGPTTTAKSQRERMLMDWLGSCKYAAGRITHAGLTAGAEKTEGMGWIIRKGLLPSMDLSWLVLDNMPPHALDNQIESRRNGVVTVTAIRSAELWARCRLKLLSNPAQPFDETMYKCTTLKVYDSKLIARFAFALFTYGVSTEERYSSDIAKPQPGDAELLDAAKTLLKWNLSQENTFHVPDELWPTIMEYGKKLEETYGCEDIPLLLRANPYKLSMVAYAFALLAGYIAPEAQHVKLAYEWLDFCARDIELDKYVEWWRSQHLLSDEEYNASKAQIESEIVADMKEHGGGREEAYIFKFVEYLAKNEKGQRDEIAAYAGVEPQTVSVKARLLKGVGLLKSDKDGYHFTAKGVRFFRKWFQGGFDLTHLTHHTGLEGHREYTADGTLEPKASVTPKTPMMSMNGKMKTEPKVSVTPKTGGIRDIGDMNNPVVAVKTWCVANRNERSEINLTDLAQFIKEELHSEPQRVVEEAFKQAILMPSPAPGKAVVV
jgi:ribosomal protein L37AE/L43A